MSLAAILELPWMRIFCGLAALGLAGKVVINWRSGSTAGDEDVILRDARPLAFYVTLAFQLFFAVLCGLVAAGRLQPSTEAL